MDWRDLVIDGYGRVLEVLEPALAGLTRADLDQRPCADCNSIGWIVWHLTRGQDAQIAALSGKEQLWTKGGWHTKFKRPADADDTGFGHTSEEVAAFKSPGRETLLEYYRATLEASKAYILTLSEAELDRKLDEPWYQPPPTVGVRTVSIMADCLEHAGEVAYLRGLLKGKGWLGY